jgi:hypothetical protein
MAVREHKEGHQPWLDTRAAIIVFLLGLVILWGAVALLFYLEIPS